MQPRSLRKLWSLILITGPSIISQSKQAFAGVPLWHCLFMAQWKMVTLAVHCSLGVNSGCQSKHHCGFSSSLNHEVKFPLPPHWRELKCSFFPYFFWCEFNYLASALLPLCITLLCCSVSFLFSSSKQVSGLFCCVMWLGVKIRKVSLCSKACNFYFYPQLLELIAKSQLTSLSGIAQKNYMNILEKVVQKGKKRKWWGGVWCTLLNHNLENSQAMQYEWREAPLLISVVQFCFLFLQWRAWGRGRNVCSLVGIWEVTLPFPAFLTATLLHLAESCFWLQKIWLLLLLARHICSLCCCLVGSVLYLLLPLLWRGVLTCSGEWIVVEMWHFPRGCLAVPKAWALRGTCNYT